MMLVVLLVCGGLWLLNRADRRRREDEEDEWAVLVDNSQRPRLPPAMQLELFVPRNMPPEQLHCAAPPRGVEVSDPGAGDARHHHQPEEVGPTGGGQGAAAGGSESAEDVVAGKDKRA